MLYRIDMATPPACIKRAAAMTTPGARRKPAPARRCSVFLDLGLPCLAELSLHRRRYRFVVAQVQAIAAAATGHGFEFGGVVGEFGDGDAGVRVAVE